MTSAGAYAVYLAIILGRVLSGPVAHVPYVPVLLWTTGASIVASIPGRVLVQTASPSDSRRGDVRDREITRFGEYASRWFLVAAAAAALVMAMAKWDYFWIANVIYLGFVLWAVVGSAVKLVARWRRSRTRTGASTRATRRATSSSRWPSVRAWLTQTTCAGWPWGCRTWRRSTATGSISG